MSVLLVFCNIHSMSKEVMALLKLGCSCCCASYLCHLVFRLLRFTLHKAPLKATQKLQLVQYAVAQLLGGKSTMGLEALPQSLGTQLLTDF